MSNENAEKETVIENESEVEAEAEDKIILRVLIYEHESSFMEKYGNYIMSELDHVELELITWPESPSISKLQSTIKEKDIDIVFPSIYYQELAAEGFLLPLDLYMDEIYLNQSYLTEVKKSVVDGKIYGISPIFSGDAIFYNKNIFDEYNVNYPHDSMSWEEVFNIASQFPVSEVVGYSDYGFYSSLVINMAISNHIDLV